MRLLRIWVVALLVLAVFAGCGGDTTPPAEEPAMEQPAMDESMMTDSMPDTGMMHDMQTDTGAMMEEGSGGE